MSRNKSFNNNNKPRSGKHPSFNRKSKYNKQINIHNSNAPNSIVQNQNIGKIDKRMRKSNNRSIDHILSKADKNIDDISDEYCNACCENIFYTDMTKLIFSQRTIAPKELTYSIKMALRPRLFRRIVNSFGAYLPQNIRKNMKYKNCNCANIGYAKKHLYNDYDTFSRHNPTKHVYDNHMHLYEFLLFPVEKQKCKRCEKQKKQKIHESQSVQLSKALMQHRIHTTVNFHLEIIEQTFTGGCDFGRTVTINITRHGDLCF